MEPLDYWRLCDEVSVVQAALLIVGEDPAGSQEHVDRNGPPRGYDAAKTALMNAITRKRLPATIVEMEDNMGRSVGETDWHLTTISVDDLRKWLQARGIRSGFFFPTPETGPDYLCREHPSYSAKLAAAVEGWKAVAICRCPTTRSVTCRWIRVTGRAR